jgi:negative regulator of sigma E activity
MVKLIKKFLAGQSGAVTVDYMVLLAAMVWLGVVSVNAVFSGSDKVASEIDDHLNFANIVSAATSASDSSASASNDQSNEDSSSSSDSASADSSSGDSSSESSSSDHGSSDHGSSDKGASSDSSGEGNPGNDKSVGHAGENPNHKGGWGSGSKGKSD